MKVLLILPILALIGVGFTYWFLQRKLENQKLRFRKRFAELEDRHESRILEAIESAQVNYQAQLKQTIDQLTQQFESRLQEAIKSLPQNSPSQFSQNNEKFKQAYESQIQEAINSLEERYENKLQQVNQFLAIANADTFLELPDNLDDVTPVDSIKNNLPQDTLEPFSLETSTTPVESSFASPLLTDFVPEAEVVESVMQETESTLTESSFVTPSIEDSKLEKEEVLEPSSLEIPPTPVESLSVSHSPGDLELEEKVLDSPTQETPATPLEKSYVLPSPWDSELEAEVIPQSNQEIQQALIENSSVNTSTTVPEGTTQSINDITNKKDQNLAQKITVMGNSRQVAYIPKLTEYITHPNKQIREEVATAIGTIAVANNRRSEVQRAIPLLGKLSQAPEPSVRRLAIEALGKIKSETVIPFLKLALRDCDREVVKLASIGLSKFKFYPVHQETKSTKTLAKTPKHHR